MARRKKGAPPSYRLHKARNLAVVTIDGRDHYLGLYGTPASRQKYAALIRAWEQRQAKPVEEREAAPLTPSPHPTINELILTYLKHALSYYKPNHGENKEAGCIDDALRILQECDYGPERADAFRPKDLKRVREAMIAKGWSRSYVNSQVSRVRRMFAHAVDEDLLPGTVYHALLVVKGLRKGAPDVREARKVKPVPGKHLKAVVGKAHKVLQAMIRFAFYTGARPGEVCELKPCYMDMTKKVWVYHVPAEHNKTEHHGQERVIFIGPKARRILKPWLEDLAPEQYVFSPIRAEAIRHAVRRAGRKTPLSPSHLRRQQSKRKSAPKRPKRDCYDPSSFRRAIHRCCDMVGIPRWSPNRLRHNAATRLRRLLGIEATRILLGHRKMSTTEIYAETDYRKAQEAANQHG